MSFPLLSYHWTIALLSYHWTIALLSYHRVIYFFNLHILAGDSVTVLTDFQGGFIKGQDAGRKRVGFKTGRVMRHIPLLQGDEFNQQQVVQLD